MSGSKSRPGWLVPLAVIGAIAVLAVLILGGSYNGLVKKRNAVDNQFAQVAVQLERRYALIPNIVNSVKGGQQQERDVINSIAQARTQYAGAKGNDEKVAASNNLESALSRLLVINEQYPDLKSNALVQNLITELEGTENRVAQERRKYNDAVTDYNNSIQSFPRNIVAGMFGFDKKNLFEVSNPSANNAPTVDFSTTSTTAAK